MPRPPILPTIEWKKVFESGQSYADWIDSAENADHVAKMEAARKELTLSAPQAAALANLPKPVHVVAIAEDWCGDVVRNVPPLACMADAAAERLHVRFVTREQHKEVFARFLTNGGEAIPKYVFLSSEFVECGNWGPMPAEHRKLIARGKAAGDVKSARERVAKLYESDPRCETVIEELLDLVLVAATVKV